MIKNREPCILVVDDDPDMRVYLRRCLRPLTERVVEAAERGRVDILRARAENRIVHGHSANRMASSRASPLSPCHATTPR